MEQVVALKFCDEIKKNIDGNKLKNIVFETGDKNLYIPKENKFIVTKTFLRGHNKIFYGCVTLETINMENFDFSEINTMNSWFHGCLKLRTIIFPKKANCNNIKYMDMTFAFTLLETIDLSFMQMPNSFHYSSYKITNDTLWTDTFFKSKVQKIILPSCVIGDMNRCFYDCFNLEEVILPVSFNFTNHYTLTQTFENCNNLKVIDFSNGKCNKADFASELKNKLSSKYDNNLREDCVIVLP